MRAVDDIRPPGTVTSTVAVTIAMAATRKCRCVYDGRGIRKHAHAVETVDVDRSIGWGQLE